MKIYSQTKAFLFDKIFFTHYNQEKLFEKRQENYTIIMRDEY